ncbi:MutS-related protein [Mucilaginibacter terrae]|uniref:Flp pilus assembly protein TadB n=1 Tax=Mucilaginibacter terrae TaxID=1955052 RepID=A0ABU3GYG9_9SPHI|nr:DNA mismatch repair protein MutS [Mucilaginibacter terrae]MDT3404817.1 Flp pilus assembly protein TadB [Mucilaginibacter terrae]
MNQQIQSIYQHNIEHSISKIQYFKNRVNLFSVMRLIVFALLLVLIYWAVKLDNFTLFAIGAVVVGITFNWLVIRQARFEKQREYFENFKAINHNELDSISHYANIYHNGNEFNNDKHYYTSDLDIFGAASLYQLINRAATPAGRQKLAGWLQAPANKSTILSRQQAVREIAAKNEWKLKVQAQLLFAQKQKDDELQQLFRYLHKPVNMPGEAWLSKYVLVVPWVMIAAIIGAIYYPEVKYIAIGVGLLNFFITGINNKHTEQTDLIAGKIGNTLNNYSDVFDTVEKEQWSAAYNSSLADGIKRTGGTSIAVITRQLSGLINSLNNRNNILIGFLLNVVLVWNVRYVIAIEKWKRANHESIEGAFDVLADFEALISLTSLSINYPQWCVPQIAEGAGYTLTAKNLSHPLIKESIRVANNYELNNTRKIDIITGSNMAGKSTFLRTLGINTVLALAGAPVCADAMQVSVVQLFSYMRIKDSLNESTSTFKAELDRLQMLLEAVKLQPNILFLIDEMLRGTNSVDKYLGSKAVIEKLISQQGVGLVATHDLQLAQLETDYPHYVRNYYFDIQVQDGEMLFDYKLKPGECKTFNASLLLERIGIFS